MLLAWWTNHCHCVISLLSSKYFLHYLSCEMRYGDWPAPLLEERILMLQGHRANSHSLACSLTH